MSRQIKPFPIRLPAELRAKLDAEHEKNGRSLNSEILSRLDASFSPAFEVGQSEGNISITGQWVVVIDAADARRLVTAPVVLRDDESGIASLDASRVILTAKPNTVAKTVLSNREFEELQDAISDKLRKSQDEYTFSFDLPPDVHDYLAEMAEEVGKISDEYVKDLIMKDARKSVSKA